MGKLITVANGYIVEFITIRDIILYKNDPLYFISETWLGMKSSREFW